MYPVAPLHRVARRQIASCTPGLAQIAMSSLYTLVSGQSEPSPLLKESSKSGTNPGAGASDATNVH